MNSKVTSLTISRAIGRAGSANLNIDLPDGVRLDPLVGYGDLDINRLVQVHAGWIAGGPTARPGFLGLVDSYAQTNTTNRRSVAVSCLSLFKELTKAPAQELLYTNITAQGLMEIIAQREGHVPEMYLDFSDTGSVVYTAVASKGSSVADVLSQIAQAARSYLYERQDGVLATMNFPEEKNVQYELDASDYVVKHKRSDMEYMNALVVYGRKKTPDELGEESTFLYDRPHQKWFARPSYTWSFDVDLDRGPADMSTLEYERFWQEPTQNLEDKDYNFQVVEEVGGYSLRISITRTDDLYFEGKARMQLRITGKLLRETYDQGGPENASSDETRIHARIVDENATLGYGQILEGKVINDYIQTESDCVLIGQHLLKERRWRRDTLTLTGPYDPRLDVGAIVTVPYEDETWICYVDSLKVGFNAANSNLTSELVCIPMRRESVTV